MPSFIDSIRERKMFRWIVGYLAAAWVMLQVLDFFGNHFHWPESVIPAATIIFGAGLFAGIILAWYHGEQGRQRVTAMEVLLLAGVVVMAGFGLYGVRRSQPPSRAGARADGDSVAVADASIAVLPFVNMSDVKDNVFFSDGITEEILNALAKVEGLHVAARTSAFEFRDTSADAKDVGRKLRVAHLLQGSVRRAGDNARITAQLIDARTGYQMWSDQYDRKLSDIFAVEDEISRSIVGQISTRLASNSVLTSGGTASSEAHDLYLQGLVRWNHRTPESLHKALDYFRAATSKDSAYAQAWAGVALALAVLPEYDGAVKPEVAWPEAKIAAETALRHDPNSAEAHAALGQIAEYSNQIGTAEREVRRAIQIKPGYMTAHQWLAEVLVISGRIPEAKTESEIAVALDPLAPLAEHVRGMALHLNGEDDKAIESYQRTRKLDPEFKSARGNLIELALETGRWDLALANLFERSRSAADSAASRLIVEGMKDPAARPAAIAAVKNPPRGGLTSESGSRYRRAIFLELMGQRADAIATVKVMMDNPIEATNLRFSLRHPSMKALREDPRMPAELQPGLNR